MKSKIVIEGGHKLDGKIKISGSKNAALPLLAATLLTDEAIEIDNLPHLDDISVMINLLLNFGAEVKFLGHETKMSTRGKTIKIQCNNIKSTYAPYDLVNKMRASIVVLGGLLARFEEVDISMPGGCAIGLRPINFHLEALKKMGATIEIKSGHVKARAKGGLKAANIEFEKISVGATENILMAAVLAEGTTKIINAALEPEVMALVDMLNSMGGKITVNKRIIKIEGVKKLSGTKITIIPDRIEAASYALAALVTNGKLILQGVNKEIFDPVSNEFNQLNAKLVETDEGVEVYKSIGKKLK